MYIHIYVEDAPATRGKHFHRMIWDLVVASDRHESLYTI